MTATASSASSRDDDNKATTATNSNNNNKGKGPPYSVIALDLDGTLLNDQHKLSDTTIQALRELHVDKGLTIVLATGRAINTVVEHVAALNLPTALPVVCSNGAAAFSCCVESGKVSTIPLFSTLVPRNVARRTMELALQHGENHYVSQYYVNNQIYAHPVTPAQHELTEMYKELTGSQTIYVQPDVFIDQMLAAGLPTKQLVLFPPAQQDSAMKQFATALQESSPDLLVDGKAATLVRGSLGWFLEVLHPNVHKGAGLERLCREYLLAPLSTVVAFGDGDNDLEFLQMAGHGVCMKNGRPVVQQVAKQITAFTNSQDGVVRTLWEMDNQGLLLTNTNRKTAVPSSASSSSTSSLCDM